MSVAAPSSTRPVEDPSLPEHGGEDMRELAARYRAIVENSRDGINLLDLATGRYVLSSPAQVALTGFTAGELRDLTAEAALDRVHPDDRALAATQQRDVAEGRSSGTTIEYRWMVKSGAYRWFSDSRSVVRNLRGEAVALVGITRDITDRRRLEDALREAASEAERRARQSQEAEAQRQLALDAACLGCFSTDVETGLTTHDRRTAEILGVPGSVARPREELLALLHPDDRDRVTAALDAALDAVEPRPFVAEYRVIRPDGCLRWVEAHGVVTFDGDGAARRARSFVGTVADVTGRKETERALLESDRRKNEFLAVLAHELRNPLAPIRNGLFLLERAAPGSEPERRARAVLRRQTEHLARLVDDLLDVARISGGKIELRRTRLDAREIVRRACEDARAPFEQRGVALGCVEPAGPAWVDADPARLAQMIGNLLTNALKFTPPGGRVDVALRCDSACRISVRDTGEGIAPDELGRLFRPFAQSERTRQRTQGGLGLGLALVRDLAERHGGSVHASSAGVGRGAEFEIALPLAAAPQLEPARPAAPAPEARPPAGGLTVLVVEDNEDAGTTLADVLGLAGHSVRLVGTGRAALDVACREPPEVLLCDIGLPDISGFEVIRALRAAAPTGRRVFALALTGFAQPLDREEALRAGFDGHLAKPPDLDALMRLLGDFAARRERAP